MGEITLLHRTYNSLKLQKWSKTSSGRMEIQERSNEVVAKIVEAPPCFSEGRGREAINAARSGEEEMPALQLKPQLMDLPPS